MQTANLRTFPVGGDHWDRFVWDHQVLSYPYSTESRGNCSWAITQSFVFSGRVRDFIALEQDLERVSRYVEFATRISKCIPLNLRTHGYGAT
jgi:hypothetical protein